MVLVLCLMMTALVTAFIDWAGREQQKVRFENAAQDMETTIQSRIEIYIALLRGLSGHFAGTDEVTREDFHKYIQRLGIAVNYPGAQGIGFSRRLRPEERGPIIRWMRSQGLSDFVIWPAAPRPEYHAIVHLEPQDKRNQAAIGFDMSTEPVRSNAMARARDTGGPALSGKVRLVQEIDESTQSGFLIYYPVYRDGIIPPTLEQRREALLGFVYAPFRADDLLGSTFVHKAGPRLHLAVYDGTRVAPENLLHRSATAPGKSETLRTTAQMEVAGHPWTLAFRSTRAFEFTPLRAAVIAAGAIGVLVSLVLFAVTLAQRRAQAAAQRSAADLAVAQEQLRQHAADLERRVTERTVSLKESVKSLESLSYSIAHDLRAPLRTVHSFSDLLLTDYAPHFDDTGRDYVRRMALAAGHMDELIQDLLAYGQLTRENLPLEPVALEPLITRLIENTHVEIETKKAEVHVARPLPSVLGNRTLIQQVTMNLLSNALKFVPQGVAPRVQISAAVLDGKVRVSVQDNGIGIDPLLQPRIFGVFERLHSKEKYPGTGIGLALVQKAVERMNGTIGVESKLGQGSTFWFELPRA
jgi:signal transduction histidine kinase